MKIASSSILSILFLKGFTSALQFHDAPKDQVEAKSKMMERVMKHAIPVPPSVSQEDKEFNSRERDLSGSHDSGDKNGGIHPFFFDPTSYSLKYTRCQNMEYYDYSGYNKYYNYNNNKNYNNKALTNVLKHKRFALFRLCPTSSCSGKNQYGCTSSEYGEYMIELSVFLEAMKDYRLAKAENWCTYCAKCVTTQQYYETAVANGNDNGYYKPCDDYSSCENYSNTCDYDDDGATAKTADNYLYCSQVVGYDSSGQFATLYAGPTCDSSNSFKVKLGLFYDKYCTMSADDTYDLNAFTSGKLTSQSLSSDYYDEGCISCKASDMPFYASNNNNDDNNNNNNYGGGNPYTYDVQETCESLYYYSAKCEAKLSVAQASSYYGYNTQYSSEEQKTTACNFIESVSRGSFNDKGELYLDQKSYNKQHGYYKKPDSHVTAAQSFWLSFFVIGSVVFAAVGVHLHRSITNTDKTVQLIYSSGYVA